MTLQAQFQALLAAQETEGGRKRASAEVTKLQVFDGIPGKILDFIMVCKLYLRMRMREVVVEQIQWILLYVQGEFRRRIFWKI